MWMSMNVVVNERRKGRRRKNQFVWWGRGRRREQRLVARKEACEGRARVSTRGRGILKPWSIKALIGDSKPLPFPYSLSSRIFS